MPELSQEAISIHAPREGSDVACRCSKRSCEISIHAPREGSDRYHSFQIRTYARFLSTLPARGATRSQKRDLEKIPVPFLSTLPARGATSAAGWSCRPQRRFLSTLPARGATLSSSWIQEGTEFLSTLPARGATGPGWKPGLFRKISIHAPREGSDMATTLCNSWITPYFYPRSPRGERLRIRRVM